MSPDVCVSPPFLCQVAEAADARGMNAEASLLRPLPFLLYFADADAEPGAYNVFQEKQLPTVQRVSHKAPEKPRVPPTRAAARGGVALTPLATLSPHPIN